MLWLSIVSVVDVPTSASDMSTTADARGLGDGGRRWSAKPELFQVEVRGRPG